MPRIPTNWVKPLITAIRRRTTSTSTSTPTSTSTSTPSPTTVIVCSGDARSCICNCGYLCGGPGRCAMDPLECLQQPQGHFVKDCHHKFTKWRTESYGGSMYCEVCGMSAMSHDMRCGP